MGAVFEHPIRNPALMQHVPHATLLLILHSTSIHDVLNKIGREVIT
jgi:hypothetical protein